MWQRKGIFADQDETKVYLNAKIIGSRGLRDRFRRLCHGAGLFFHGNGRISRTITDLLLARADEMSHRFYSMSARIRKQRKSFYEILEKTQKGGLDITGWIEWFRDCLEAALTDTEKQSAPSCRRPFSGISTETPIMN